MKRVFVLSFLYLIIYSVTAFAKPGDSRNVTVPAHTRYLTVHDGLAGETVYRIFKSRWNVIWIGTNNGISSYDGYQIKTYRVGTQRSKNIVLDIAQADDGFIWAATADGLYKVDGSKKWMVRAAPELTGRISCLKIRRDSVYAGSEDGLFMTPTKKGTHSGKRRWLTKSHIKGQNRVNDITFEGDKLWVLGDYELYRYDTGTGRMQQMGIRQKLNISTPMRCMAVAGKRIIIGTHNDGLLVYDKQTGDVAQYIDAGCRVITCLSVAGDTLHVGTDGAGLHNISLKEDRIIETFSTNEDSRYRLRDNTVYAFLHDKSGIDFFGYFRQGVQHNYFFRPLFHVYPGTEGRNIRSVCIDGTTKVLGSRGGLWLIDEKQGTTKFFSPKELGGSIVTNVVEYEGEYYCCTFNGGVMRINPKTLTTSRFGKSDALRKSSFGCLCVSPDNELWMSGNAGVYIYNARTGSERHYDSHNSQLPDAYCNSLLFDRQNRCWISTAKGLCLYDPITKKIYANGFPKGFFNASSETHGFWGHNDDLLFYCQDGLMRTNEEMSDFGTITSPYHLTDEQISQAIYDKRHRVYWIATESGMYRFDHNRKTFSKFSAEAGLYSREFSNAAIHIADNVLWIGTMNGLFYADLDEAAHFSMGKATILLNSPEFGNRPATDKETVSLLRERVANVAFHWKAETFSFVPVLLNYANQQELCFEYRIGTDSEWKEPKGTRRISLDNLPLGQNILQVRIAGSSDISEYRVYVFPSGWFFFECIVALMFAAISAVIFRQRMRFKRQQEEMMRIQKELEETKRKYSRVNTNETEQQRLFRRLEDYMRSEKPFLSPDLKLSDVAAHLECSTVKLSQLFSTFVGMNYYDYVNRMRLEEFKQRAGMARYKQYTLMALAEECGFRRSSFFTTFKKVDGITPMEFVRGKKETDEAEEKE